MTNPAPHPIAASPARASTPRPNRVGTANTRGGFSLPELLVTIALLGVLAAIAVQSYRGIQTAARETTARDTLALLNRALLHYSQAKWEITLGANPGATSDELAVLRTLQWRDPDLPGSPYIPANFCDTTSSADADYRLRWNGRTFELLTPGTAGSGIRAASSASTYTFPADYQPLARGQQHE